MLAVTADSNVWISAFNFYGKPRRLIDMADAALARIDISDAIIRRSAARPPAEISVAVRALQEAKSQMNSIAVKVTPTQAVDIVKADPADNRILECAAEAKSDDVVTGDGDLLRIVRFGRVPIVTVADFLEILAQGEGQSSYPPHCHFFLANLSCDIGIIAFERSRMAELMFCEV